MAEPVLRVAPTVPVPPRADDDRHDEDGSERRSPAPERPSKGRSPLFRR